MTTPLLIDGPDNATTTFILAHGAGAGMEHEFMQAMAAAIASAGIRVIRFEFPYMQKRRLDGLKYPPDRAPKAIAAFEAVIEQVQQQFPDTQHWFIGGKSMGGKLASMIAADSAERFSLAGVICLGFPFTPPNKPENFRGQHLESIATPVLIIQGQRDTFGGEEAIKGFPLSKNVSVQILPDGDHSFKPRVKSGFTLQQNMDAAVEEVVRFFEGLG
ncbi:hypothetical protein SIN8267_02169 [Sinobacterium norvegicum]|uniref:KANL3/Tex30 alpha/beta hydrolase-like domain-containing protein n=1 Tax=Sinobacterium norvegicum TaxID=1641715 RepID=A0ABN8EI58_9GAMM|nr:alpha/beta family hydrolase [Sinobacterium norvegicum]CAH0992054.1 hypothetical protein SIN8267_02169 [Sinobacterium norvegicum]